MTSKDEERAGGAEEEDREDSDSPAEDGEGEGSEEDGDTDDSDDADAGDSDDADAGDSDEDDARNSDDDDTGDSDEEDEEAGDSDEDEDDDEAEELASPEPKDGKRKVRAKASEGMSPGARLAAAKARKARRKQAKRGKDAEVVESAVLKKADRATEWAQENRRTLWIALAAVAAIILGTIVWNQQSSARETEASAALWEAVEGARAEIRPEGGLDDVGDDDRETFPDVQTRAETALQRFQKVIADYGGTEPAIWARLGEAGALMELDQTEEARDAYQKALGEGGDDPMVAWRALEGIAFTYESDESWDQALARFQELGDSGEGELRDIADYHIARVHLAQGDEVRAKELLRALVEKLRGEREPGAPELSYVLSQAEIRLMEIDSSFAQQRPAQPSFGGFPGAGGGGGDPSEQLSPEQMQELLKMLEQRGMGGEPGGGGE